MSDQRLNSDCSHNEHLIRIKVDLKESGRAVAMVTPMTSAHCAMHFFQVGFSSLQCQTTSEISL